MPFLPPNQQRQSTDGNLRIWITEKTLEFSSAVLPAPSAYHITSANDSGWHLFVDLRRSDTGVYTCRAVSETGETARGAALTVDSPTNPEVIFHRTPEPSTFPGSPAKPSVTDVTDSSVLLSWRPSSTHGASPVFAYTVEYFSHDTGEVRLIYKSTLKNFTV